MDTLLRMQASYDIPQTRKHEKQIHVLRIHHVAPFTRQEISTRWRSHVRVCRASASSKSPYRKCPGVKHLDPRECSARPAHLSIRPVRAHRVVQPLIERRADVVYGSRFLSARPHGVLYFRHSVSRILTLLSNALTNINLSDVETCYKASPRDDPVGPAWKKNVSVSTLGSR